MRRGSAAAPVFVLAVAAVGAGSCVSLPPALDVDAGEPPACESRGPDNDGDGYPSCGAPRNDCDDDDATIHPGARELCGDAIDQDCGGVDDDLDCVDEVVGNTTPTPATGEPWTLVNEALEIAFGRGTSPPGVYGPIQLLSRAGSGRQLLTVDAIVLGRFFAVSHTPDTWSWRSADAPSVFTVHVNGAAVTQVSTTWADGGDTGTSTFTMYPDGRIHRHDEVIVNRAAGNYLTSYINLDPTRLDHADWDTATAPELLDLATSMSYIRHDQTEPSHACLFSSTTGDRVIVTARPVSGADGLRVMEGYQFPGPIHLAAIAFDWQHNAPVVTGTYAADLLVHVGVGTGARPCVDGGGVTAPFLSPPALSGPEGASVYDPRTGSYAVGAGGAQVMAVTLAQPVPSLALHVTSVPNRHDPVLVRDNQRLVRGRDYHLQHGSDDVWLIVLGAVGTSGLRIDWP